MTFSVDIDKIRGSLREAFGLLRQQGYYAYSNTVASEAASFSLKNGQINNLPEVTSGSGINLFVLKGGYGGFASATITDSLDSLVEQAIASHKSNCQHGQKIILAENQVGTQLFSSRTYTPEQQLSITDKVDFFSKYTDPETKSAEIFLVMSSYREAQKLHLFCDSDGNDLLSHTYRILFSYACYARQGAVTRNNSMRIFSYDCFNDIFYKPDFKQTIAETDRLAVALTVAPDLPADLDYDLFALDHDILGLVLHEALGHAVEGDHIATGKSGFGHDGLMRENLQVAPDYCDVIIDPSMQNCGYTPFDYEGVIGGPTTIVKDGILVDLIHSRETATLMDGKPNGHSRAQGVFSLPQNRMTSIYLKPHKTIGDLEGHFIDPAQLRDLLVEKEVLKDGRKLLFLQGWRGGTATCSNLEYRADIKFLYLLEAGKEPVLYRQANLTGIAHLTLQNMTAAIGPLRVESFGMCGKNGQSVPTSDGGPQVSIFNKHPETAIIGSN